MPLGRLPSLGCAVLIAALGQTSLPAHAQSLVDVARLVRDIRERHGPPTKVYTNEDLPDTGRITGPTRSWASRSRSLREAACERERARIALRCERPVTQPAPVPVKTVPVDPAPTPATSGIPLSLVYSFVASPHSQRPRPSTTASKSPRRHQRGSRAAGPAISTPDNGAPNHLWQTDRALHQAPRGQEWIRTVEPTVPLHRPRSPGARRGSDWNRRQG